MGQPEARKRHVLVTGAAGRIGSYFAEHSFGRYDLRLMVQHEGQADSVRAFGEIVQGDLSGPLVEVRSFILQCDRSARLA